jgi:hypothetical protein
MKGALIQCYYWVEIVAKIVLTPDVGLQIPIHLYAPVSMPVPGTQYALPQVRISRKCWVINGLRNP